MKYILPVIFFLSLCKSNLAQSGTLDYAFGDSGKVATNRLGICYAAALNPDGKILAGGSNFTVVQFLPNGQIDSLFGEHGIGVINNEQFTSGTASTAMVVLNDKSILAAGSVNNSAGIVKFKEDGHPDSSFGINGTAIIDFGQKEGVTSIQLQADGKIILGGLTYKNLDAGTFKLLARLNPNGTPDESFGDKGRVIDSSGDKINCLALQQDGKIVAGGEYFDGETYFSVSRYNPNGSIDKAFGKKGTVVTDISPQDDYLYAISLLADGKIAVAGRANLLDETNSYMAVVRYNSDGTLDSIFAESGIARILFEGKESSATGLLVQEDGKLIATGKAFARNENTDFALARLKVNGSLDSSFGIEGQQTSDFGSFENSNASILQPDGKIILAGNDGVSFDFLLVRYNNDPTQRSIITKIRRWLHRHGITWDDLPWNKIRNYTVERSADGIHFNEISTVAHTASQSNLSYEDKAPLSGDNYYRLRAESTDGAVSYSNVVAIEANTSSDKTISIKLYPNPVKDVLNIVGIDQLKKYEVRITNENGNVLAHTSINHTSKYSWKIQSLNEGIYYLSVQSKEETITLKFVKD